MAMLGRLALRSRRALSTSTDSQSKVAVVLSGCGVYDGSEIHEASATLVHLSRHGANVSVFAPNVPQMHVIDHTKTEPAQGEARNVLVESARIARGSISPLSTLSASEFDAIVFPGGFGAAKNLSTFAVDGAGMSVDDDVQRVLEEFNKARKPIGLCCISPVLAAKVLSGVEVTVGRDDDPAAEAIASMGGKHINKPVTEAHVDEDRMVVTSPAFMYGDAPFHDVFDGIGEMVSKVMKLIKN